MCLTKNKNYHPHNRPLRAKEDIVCYKVLRIKYITNIFVTTNVFVTLYTYTIVPKECLKNKVPFKAKILNKFRFICRHVLGLSDIVTDGFIHTYLSEPPYDGLRFCECVFKCIIPKGTKYFIGEDGDSASEQIIFVEQLK